MKDNLLAFPLEIDCFWKPIQFKTAQHKQKYKKGKIIEKNVLVLFYFHEKRWQFSCDNSVPWICRQTVPKGLWSYVGSPLSQQHERQKTVSHHSRQTVFTGLHNNYSLQSFHDSSDLESWALVMSLWPPNASLLFCQKEVLMLLRWHFHVEIVLDKWVVEYLDCWPVLLPSPLANCHTHALQCQTQNRWEKTGTLLFFHSPRWGANLSYPPGHYWTSCRSRYTQIFTQKTNTKEHKSSSYRNKPSQFCLVRDVLSKKTNKKY